MPSALHSCTQPERASIERDAVAMKTEVNTETSSASSSIGRFTTLRPLERHVRAGEPEIIRDAT